MMLLCSQFNKSKTAENPLTLRHTPLQRPRSFLLLFLVAGKLLSCYLPRHQWEILVPATFRYIQREGGEREGDGRREREREGGDGRRMKERNKKGGLS